MSDIQRIASPDQRFFILLISTDPPTHICLGEQRDMVEPYELAGGCQSLLTCTWPTARLIH